MWRPPADAVAWVDLASPPPGWEVPAVFARVTRATCRWRHADSGATGCVFRVTGRRVRQGPTTILLHGGLRLLALRPLFDGTIAPVSGVTRRRFPPDVRAAALDALAVGGTAAFDAVVSAYLGGVEPLDRGVNAGSL